jgi:precorrin-2 dehydrogenase/sirohydrochlorin ferrochelatase
MLGVLGAMRYLPILVDLAGRPCLVVGGGAVAARKVEQLLGAGASVTVVATRIGARMTELAAVEPRLRVEERRYRADDLQGVALAFAATDDPALQESIAAQARATGVWLNAVDEPERCSFVMPAILDRDPLLVAVSTSGASPALARRIRDDLDEALGPEYAAAVDTLAKLRRRYAPGRRRQEALMRLVDGGLLEALRGGDERRVDELIATACADLPEQHIVGGLS